MPKRPAYDSAALQALRESQFNVITRRQARACMMAVTTIGNMSREGGPWQVMLPGVYLTVTGNATQEQREMAALLYAGESSMLTGPCAVRRHQLAVPDPGVIDVLVPITVRRVDAGFVRLHRTERLPGTYARVGPLRIASATRAVADTARAMATVGEVRPLVYEAVQKRKCTTAQLLHELHEGPTRRCALLRQILDEVLTGVRSVAEKDLHDLIRRAGVPEPRFNARLYTMDGTFIAMVDGWWEEAGTAAQVDSVAYHSSPAAQDKDRKNSTTLTTHGVYPLRFSAYQIRNEKEGVLADIRAALARNRRQVPLPIVAVGPDEQWTPEATARMRMRMDVARAVARRSAETMA